MTTPGGQKPAPATAGSAGVKAPRPGRVGLATTETFGRFIRNLAKLEGNAAGKGRKGKGGSR
jgi:hypothetical protein